MHRPLAALAAGIAVLLAIPVAQAAFPGPNGKILFTWRQRIAAVNPDGSGRADVSTGSADMWDGTGAWSPDVGRIVFKRWNDVYVQEVGGEPVNLTADDDATMNSPSSHRRGR